MRWVGHVARVEEKRNVYILLVGKSIRESKTEVDEYYYDGSWRDRMLWYKLD
jgi:hypothetical protein